MSEVVITIETSEAHAWIRALEDAGCYGKANQIREVAGCPDTDCVVDHKETA